MPSKNPEVNKRARDKWYKINKVKQIEKQMKRRKSLLDWIDAYRKTLECKHCGRSFKNNPEWCDFHHLDPKEKEGGIGELARSSIKGVMKEIEKCIPLCALCHRTEHRNARHYSLISTSP